MTPHTRAQGLKPLVWVSRSSALQLLLSKAQVESCRGAGLTPILSLGNSLGHFGPASSLSPTYLTGLLLEG